MTENQTEIPPNKISSITSQQRQAIEAFAQSQLPRAGDPSREETQYAIYRMYDHLGLPTPTILWCRSPFQAAVMPFLLNVLMAKTNQRTRRMRHLRQTPEDLREEVRSSLYGRLFNPSWSGALADLLSQLDPVTESELAPGGNWTMLDHESTIKKEMQDSFTTLAAGVHARMDSALSHDAAHTLKRARFSTEVVRNRVLANVQAQLSLADGVIVNDTLLGMLDRRTLPVSPERLAADLALQLGTHFSLNIIHQLLGVDESEQNFLPHRSPSFVERKLAQALDQSQVSVKWSAWANDEFQHFQLPLECIGPDFYPEIVKQHLSIWWNFRNAAPAYNAFRKVIFASQFPTVLDYNERGALHNLSGPALAFRDGYRIYAVNGTTVESQVIENPNFLTIDKIESERNLERRRVYIDIYGLPRYLLDSRAIVVSKDECGVLYRKEIRGDEPLVVVCVTNSTPEPDGTFKKYFLRVPPDILTARAAVAWTFGLTKEEYQPAVQT